MPTRETIQEGSEEKLLGCKILNPTVIYSSREITEWELEWKGVAGGGENGDVTL